MGQNTLEFKQPTRLCQLSETDLQSLLHAVHDAVLSTSVMMGNEFFATAIISSQSRWEYECKQAA